MLIRGNQPIRSRSDVLGLEGGRISVSLVDGSRIDDVELVSVGRLGVDTLWVYAQGTDLFVPFADVVDIWPAHRPGDRHAA
jgi:hypothetical protein